MRIAHIHWSLGTGGIETMLPDIVSEQAKTNDVMLIIVNDWVESSILSKVERKVKVVLLGRHPGSKSLWPIIKLNFLLLKFRPDIIHTHAYKEINLVLYPFGKRVRTIHNTNNVCDEYHKYSKLIAISKAVQDFTLRQGFESVLAENGIPVKRIMTKGRNAFADGRLHLVQVSRLDVEQKGQDILIKALDLVRRKYGYSNFVMHFIGKGNDEAMLKQLSYDLHLEDNIAFEGLKDQKWVYENLCDFDLFVQPSRYEGFGLTVAEAMAAKLPVLVSNIEGPLEIIDGGRLGLTFESENISDCAEKINYFIQHGRSESQVDEAYQYVCEHYDVSVTAEKYLEIYKSIQK